MITILIRLVQKWIDAIRPNKQPKGDASYKTILNSMAGIRRFNGNKSDGSE